MFFELNIDFSPKNPVRLCTARTDAVNKFYKMMHSDGLKIVVWLGTSNQSALFQHGVVMLYYFLNGISSWLQQIKYIVIIIKALCNFTDVFEAKMTK